MAKKKKSGRIAVPFLITVFLGLLIVGGGAYGIYKYFGLGNEQELKEPSPRVVATTSYEDSHTVLLVLDEPDLKCSSTFVLMRSIPKDKKLMFLGLPTNMITVIDGVQRSLSGSYKAGGVSAAKEFVEIVFGITIDRYMKFDGNSLKKACDMIGGVNYPVKVQMSGFNSDGSEQYLSGEQIEKFITYSMFDEGEVQRAYIASSVISDMINQADGKRLADGLDNSFNTIINMVDSDITAVDYKKRKTAIKNMLSRSESISRFLTMDGNNADADFIPSEGFIKNIVEEYFAVKTG
jgi:anionic cell wall polymer biosynthesis LytR-Cps2A-Psr (LCP) family protein